MIKLIPSGNMVADGLTKVLPKLSLSKLLHVIDPLLSYPEILPATMGVKSSSPSLTTTSTQSSSSPYSKHTKNTEADPISVRSSGTRNKHTRCTTNLQCWHTWVLPKHSLLMELLQFHLLFVFGLFSFSILFFSLFSILISCFFLFLFHPSLCQHKLAHQHQLVATNLNLSSNSQTTKILIAKFRNLTFWYYFISLLNSVSLSSASSCFPFLNYSDFFSPDCI